MIEKWINKWKLLSNTSRRNQAIKIWNKYIK